MELYIGKRVMIKPDLNETDTMGVGICVDMMNFIGKILTIELILISEFDGLTTIMLKEDSQWIWTPNCFIEPFKNQKELLSNAIKNGMSSREYKKSLINID